MKFLVFCVLIALTNALQHEQLAHQIANSINYDLQGTSSSFTRLLQANQLSDDSSAKVSVGVFAAVLVKVESQSHTVHINNALLGGLELHQNQQNNHRLNENLRVLKEQVETHANKLGPNEIGIFVGSLFGGNQTVHQGNSDSKSNFTGGYWVGIRTNVTQGQSQLFN